MAKQGMPKPNIPQNSAGHIQAMNLNKKNPAPKKTTGKDLRSGK